MSGAIGVSVVLLVVVENVAEVVDVCTDQVVREAKTVHLSWKIVH